MKTTQPTHKKRNALIIVLIVLFVAAGAYCGAALKLQLWPFSSKSSEVTTEQKQAANNKTDDSTKAIAAPTDTTPVDNTKTSDQVPVDTTAVATITQLEQTDQNILFAANISNSSDAGTCVVNFTNPNDKPVTKQIDSTTKGGSSICGPLTISNLEFSYLGEWSVSLNFYSAGKQVSTSGKIVIK